HLRNPGSHIRAFEDWFGEWLFPAPKYALCDPSCLRHCGDYHAYNRYSKYDDDGGSDGIALHAGCARFISVRQETDQKTGRLVPVDRRQTEINNISHDLQTVGTHFFERVVGSVPRGVIEVDQIDGRNSDL